MDMNILGICITVLLGLIAISLAIFFGLHGFKKDLSEKVTTAKTDIIGELSGIKQNITKLDGRADTILQLANLYFGQKTGTIYRELKHFGRTKISAEPGDTETKYLVQVEKGKLSDKLIWKLSKETDLARSEIDMFSREAGVISLGSNALHVTVPSTDPALCTQYMSMFLKWLDTEYADRQKHEITDFEEGITI